jgi:hypothetical protein
MRLATLSCLAVSIFATALIPVSAEDDPVFSGPQPGEKLVSFKIKNVLTEPAKEVDLIAAADGKPVLIVFFHKRTRPAFGLTNTLMRYALTRTKAGLTSGVAFLTEDATETENWVKRVRGNFPKGATVGVSQDGIEGPGAYGLNREVELTILIGKNGKTTANFALVQPSLEADGPKIAKALAEVLGDQKPVDLANFGGRQMRKTDAKPKRPAANPRGEPLPPELVAKLRAFINKDNSPEDVDKAATIVEEAIEKDEKSRRQVGDVASRVIAGWAKNKNEDRYSTKRAREYLKKWAKEYGPKEGAPKPKEGALKPKAEGRTKKGSRRGKPATEKPATEIATETSDRKES